MNSEHILDIQKYSLSEIFALFDLSTDNLTLDDLKRAKKKVVLLHPDKSKLSPEYFLFYKSAFVILTQVYNAKNKERSLSPSNNPQYNEIVEEINETPYNAMKDMNQSVFNKNFNKIFELSKPTKTTKNDWFSNEEPSIETPITKANINSAFDSMKRQKAITIVQDIQPVIPICGNDLYDDIDDDSDNSQYVSSDIFGKLKFDDLRKVHKDQTIFAVGEHLYNPFERPSNIDQYTRQRGVSITPIEKNTAEQLLMEKERILQKQMEDKHYKSLLRTQEFQQKNKSAISSILRIT